MAYRDSKAEFRRRVMEHKRARGLATRAMGGFRRSKNPADKMKALEVAAIAQALGLRAGGVDQAKRIEGQVRAEMMEDARQGEALRGQRAIERARQIRALKNLEIFRPREPKQKEAPAAQPPEEPKEGLQAYVVPGEGEEFGYIEGYGYGPPMSIDPRPEPGSVQWLSRPPRSRLNPPPRV